jgi:hypothetical protein
MLLRRLVRLADQVANEGPELASGALLLRWLVRLADQAALDGPQRPERVAPENASVDSRRADRRPSESGETDTAGLAPDLEDRR